MADRLIPSLHFVHSEKNVPSKNAPIIINGNIYTVSAGQQRLHGDMPTLDLIVFLPFGQLICKVRYIFFI